MKLRHLLGFLTIIEWLVAGVIVLASRLTDAPVMSAFFILGMFEVVKVGIYFGEDLDQ